MSVYTTKIDSFSPFRLTLTCTGNFVYSCPVASSFAFKNRDHGSTSCLLFNQQFRPQDPKPARSYAYTEGRTDQATPIETETDETVGAGACMGKEGGGKKVCSSNLFKYQFMREGVGGRREIQVGQRVASSHRSNTPRPNKNRRMHHEKGQ